MKKYIKIFCLIIFISLLAGCKTSQVKEADTVYQMPAKFVHGNDSTSIATINWREYFTDPDLAGLIDTALTNNFDLLSAMQRVEMSRSQVLLNKGALFPAVSGNGSIAQRRFGLYTMDGAGNISTYITPGQIVPINLPDYYIGLQSSWEVDIWGKLRNRKRAAVNRYLSTIEGKNLIITNLIAEVALSYYELLALDYELDIIRETIQLQEEALTIVQIQKQTGVVNELAVQQFEGLLLNSKAMEKEALQLIIESENKINFLLGRFPQPVKRNKSIFTKVLPFEVKTGISSDLLKNRPDIRQAEYELIASKADVRAAKMAFYPSLHITGAYGFQAFKTNFLFTTPESMAYTILGNLTAPLINRSAIKAEFKNANAQQQEALYNYQKSILNGYVEVYNELVRIKNLEQIQEFRSRQVDVLTESIETSSELFRNGRASYLEVIMTQRNALDTRLELAEVTKRQYFTIVNIYKALGGGWQ